MSGPSLSQSEQCHHYGDLHFGGPAPAQLADHLLTAFPCPSQALALAELDQHRDFFPGVCVIIPGSVSNALHQPSIFFCDTFVTMLGRHKGLTPAQHHIRIALSVTGMYGVGVEGEAAMLLQASSKSTVPAAEPVGGQTPTTY